MVLGTASNWRILACLAPLVKDHPHPVPHFRDKECTWGSSRRLCRVEQIFRPIRGGAGDWVQPTPADPNGHPTDQVRVGAGRWVHKDMRAMHVRKSVGRR